MSSNKNSSNGSGGDGGGSGGKLKDKYEPTGENKKWNMFVLR